MSRPSVLHVLARPGGGGERYARTLAEGMTGYEHHRYLLTNRHNPIKRPPPQALAKLPALRRAIKRHQLVHMHGAPTVLMCLPLINLRPTVFTTHGLHLVSSARPRSPVAAAGLRWALSHGVQAIAVSTADRDVLAALAPLKAGSTTVILNAAEIEPPPAAARSELRRELGLADSTIAVIFVGELIEQKQPVQFVEAVNRARAGGADVTGIVVGDGPLRESVEAEAGDGTKVLGPRQDVGALLAATDAFVLTGIHNGISLALMEAMHSGRPIIIYDLPDNREAVGDAGVIVPIGDVDALRDAIVSLASDPELRGRLGEAARRRALESFSLRRMLDETAAVYERALAAAR